MTRNVDNSPVRVVVQNGEHWMRNIGDLAMLSVALRRMREHWSGASLHVMTSAPALLRAYHPDIQPVSDGRMPRFLGEPLAAAGSRLGLVVAGLASMGSLRAREGLLGVVERLRNAPRAAPVTTSAEVSDSDGAGPDISSRPAVEAAFREASLVLAMKLPGGRGCRRNRGWASI